ncbi:MAG: hypothetical protein JRN52_02295 [Nitrososphaerota archaeon]|nr:hypothetical protein [Nitrososphaerota archaeon]
MAATLTQALLSAKKSSDLNRAGLFFALAGIEFILGVSALQALYPNYSVHSNALSNMAAIGAPTAIPATLVAIISDLCWLFGAYFLFRNTGKRALLVVYSIPPLAFLLPALSPENFIPIIHFVGGAVHDIVGAAVAILTFWIVKSPFRYFSIALGLLTAAGIVILFRGYYTPLVQMTLGPGGWEEIYQYSLEIWLIGLGSALLGFGRSVRQD